MNKKIVSIVFCTLAIATVSTTLVSSHSIEKPVEKMMPSVIDQQQPNTPELYWLDYGVPNWQQFKNKGNILEMVDLHIGCYFSGSPDITLTIKETLTGTPLTWITYPATALPDNFQAWFTFIFST